jgi:nicotinamidase-related amidase
MRVLVVVDMQNDFIDGVLGTKEAVEIVDSVKAKINSYHKAGDVIIYTKDTHTDEYLQTQELFCSSFCDLLKLIRCNEVSYVFVLFRK